MTTATFATTKEAVAAFEAQGALTPGAEGWWKVWGATPADARPGDLLGTLAGEEVALDLLTATADQPKEPA